MTDPNPPRNASGRRNDTARSPEQFTGKKGVYTKTPDMLRSFDEITDGKADDLPEQALLYVGDINEARAKAKSM